jgi:AcrR family transcriptional regulator
MKAQTTELTRRDRNKLRNRKEILDAALEVFAEKGYQNASVQEIADRADFAVSTLYALFEGKEDLYRQVSVEIGREAGKIFSEAMDRGGNEYEKLVNYARAKGDAFRAFQAGSRMLEHEMQVLNAASADTAPKDGIGQIYARFMKRIEGLFTTGIENGLFVQGDPLLMTLSLDASTNALMRLSYTQPTRYDYDANVNEVIRLFFEPVLKTPGTGQA